MKVKVFHQAGFEGMHRGWRPEDALKLVFELDMPHTWDLHRAAQELFEQFNLGNTELGQAYYAARNRSLSVGDVLTFDDTRSVAVDHTGFSDLETPVTETTPGFDRVERAYEHAKRDVLMRLAGITIHDDGVADASRIEDDATREEALRFWDDVVDYRHRHLLTGLRIGHRGSLSTAATAAA